jgi:hypothetical protein
MANRSLGSLERKRIQRDGAGIFFELRRRLRNSEPTSIKTVIKSTRARGCLDPVKIDPTSAAMAGGSATISQTSGKPSAEIGASERQSG